MLTYPFITESAHACRGFRITRDHGDHVRSRRLSTCQSLCRRVTACSIRWNRWHSCCLWPVPRRPRHQKVS